MSEKTFAFRMPPELKDAAKALSKLSFTEWYQKDGKQLGRGMYLSSINDSLAYMAQIGASYVSMMIDADVSESKGRYDFWKEMVSYFIDHPDINEIVASDFPENSPMRLALQNNADEDDEAGEDIDLTMVTRMDAFTSLADVQKLLVDRTKAKAALVKASSDLPMPHPTSGVWS